MEQIILTTKGIPFPNNIEDETLTSIVALLVTTNINETSAIRNLLKPLDGRDNIYRFSKYNVTYYIGKYGNCPAATTEVHGSAINVPKMAKQYFPNLFAIISVGVAVGIKGDGPKIFDVLVSSQVINLDESTYNHSSQGEKQFIILSELENLFNNHGQLFQWPNDEMKKHLNEKGNYPVPNVLSGTILSIPYTLNDHTVLELVEKFPDAIGIEVVDGIHLSEEIHMTTINFIIVKAVCGFGDQEICKKNQPTAALMAADLVHKCLDHHQAHEIFHNKS